MIFCQINYQTIVDEVFPNHLKEFFSFSLINDYFLELLLALSLSF
jgi:hypothetical protein